MQRPRSGSCHVNCTYASTYVSLLHCVVPLAAQALWPPTHAQARYLLAASCSPVPSLDIPAPLLLQQLQHTVALASTAAPSDSSWCLVALLLHCCCIAAAVVISSQLIHRHSAALWCSHLTTPIPPHTRLLLSALSLAVLAVQPALVLCCLHINLHSVHCLPVFLHTARPPQQPCCTGSPWPEEPEGPLEGHGRRK